VRKRTLDRAGVDPAKDVPQAAAHDRQCLKVNDTARPYRSDRSRSKQRNADSNRLALVTRASFSAETLRFAKVSTMHATRCCHEHALSSASASADALAPELLRAAAD
jgi:hypothetical protein